MYEDQGQEDAMYEATCYDNEFQAAYDLSRRERKADDKAKINALVKAGRFVVYSSTEDYCRFTDALLGERQTFVADFASYEEALPELTSDDLNVAMPRVQCTRAPTPAPTVGDDIPF